MENPGRNQTFLKSPLPKKDLRESFIRSPGPGGQNVNKVATCVCLEHIPTGITVKCHKERSRELNRLAARRILWGKLKARQETLRRQAVDKREAERRRHRPRPAGLREKILQDKHRRAETRKRRQKIHLQKQDSYL